MKQKKENKKGIVELLVNTQPTKKDALYSLLESGKDLVVGTGLGGALGASTGRYSIVIGLLINTAGHYFDRRLLKAIGIGMMTASSYSKKEDESVDGLPDNIKTRLMAFKDDLKAKFFIDKLQAFTKENEKATSKAKEESQQAEDQTVGAVNTYEAPKNIEAKAEADLDAIADLFAKSAEEVIENQALDNEDDFDQDEELTFEDETTSGIDDSSEDEIEDIEFVEIEFDEDDFNDF